MIDQLVRVYGREPDDVHADLVLLSTAGMQLAAVSAETGMLAGRLRARHYHRERMAVGLAECMAAATALSGGRALATSDPPLAALVRAEGGTVSPLPDTSGRPPQHCWTSARTCVRIEACAGKGYGRTRRRTHYCR